MLTKYRSAPCYVRSRATRVRVLPRLLGKGGANVGRDEFLWNGDAYELRKCEGRPGRCPPR